MKLLSMPAALCAAGLSIGAAQAAIIVVNPGQDIQAAVDKAQPGDTVRVLAGTYKAKVLISGRKGADGAPITLKGDPGAIISGVDLVPVDREGLITIRNSDYIRVEGFDIADFISNGPKKKGGESPTPVGILIEGHGANLQIVNNSIHGIRNNTTCSGDSCEEGANGLAVYGTDATGVTDLLVQGNSVYGNVLQSSEALVLNGNVDRFQVLDNKVYGNNNIGYDFIGYEGECKGCGEKDRARNGLVRGNLSQNNSSVTNPWYGYNTKTKALGEASAAGFYVDGGRNIIFDRNISVGNDIGFEFASETSGKATEDILMTNNMVANNGEAGLSIGGDTSANGSALRIDIHNNAFYKNMGTWGTELVLKYKVKDSNFSNNIVFGKSTLAKSYSLTKNGGQSNNHWGTNMWWGTNTDPDGLPGTRIVAEPGFVAPDSANLRLKPGSRAMNAGAAGVPLTWSSPLWTKLFDKGIPLNGDKDFDGGPRIVDNIIDLGADEVDTSPAAVTIPAAPTLPVATAVSSSQVNLSWRDNAADEGGFRIERSLNAASGFLEIAVAPANTSAWQDNGLRGGTSYFYRLRSTNAAGSSGYTAVVNASTPATGVAGITVDGKSADWGAIAPLSMPAGGLTALKAHADSNYLYVLVTGAIGSNHLLFINSDNAAQTGYKAGAWSAEGSDYVLENGELYKYKGTGADWKWSTSGVAQAGVQVVKNAQVLELKIPRASLPGSGAAIRLGVEFADGGWNTTGNIPASGGAQAQFKF